MAPATHAGNRGLQQRRQALDLTQEDLAACVGCARITVQKIELGERRPSRQMAARLAHCLQVPAAEQAAFIRQAREQPVGENGADNAPRASAAPAHPPRPPLSAAGGLARPTNLPVQLTRRVGRTQVLAAVLALLRPAGGAPAAASGGRLLTLTGPPGIGKTRLALEVATQLVADFPDGVWQVSLAPLTDPALVASAIAQALGLKVSGSRPLPEVLTDYLRGRQLLLVLDNCEQVIAAAPWVADQLAAAPRLWVLATSREALRVRGEQEFVVPPLTLPPRDPPPSAAQIAESEAVQLFTQCALAANADFRITDQHAPVIAAICWRLDGLPLAIELAAARVKLLPPEALLARLGHRLQLLTGGARDVPARHQTLRNAIAWSYDLLDEDEKTLFRRMGVFAGGGTLEAVEAVCHAPHAGPAGVLDGLASLANKSLLTQSGVHGEPRVAMLETILEYAREALDRSVEAGTIRQRHAAFFLALAEAAAVRLVGPEQQHWLARLETEHNNLRAALNWLLARGAAEEAARLGSALGRFWLLHGDFSEGRRRMDAVLDLGHRVSAPTRAAALSGAGRLAWRQGDLRAAGILHEEALALRRELEDTRGVGESLYHLGTVAVHAGRREEGAALYAAGLVLLREAGDRPSIAQALNNLGEVARERGDYAQAGTLYAESLALWRALGDRHSSGLVLHNLGQLACQTGNYALAGALFAESLGLQQEVGTRWGVAGCIAGFGRIALELEEPERALRLMSAARALTHAIGARADSADKVEAERNWATAHARLSEEAHTKAVEDGQAMRWEEAIAYALEVLALIARERPLNTKQSV